MAVSKSAAHRPKTPAAWEPLTSPAWTRRIPSLRYSRSVMDSRRGSETRQQSMNGTFNFRGYVSIFFDVLAIGIVDVQGLNPRSRDSSVFELSSDRRLHRQDKVKSRQIDGFHRTRTMPADIRAPLRHDSHGVYSCWHSIGSLKSSAFYVDSAPGKPPDDSFRHCAPTSISRADDEHSLWPSHTEDLPTRTL